ncbi:unnamed protein product, partial [Chrysoparadoxa australica]
LAEGNLSPLIIKYEKLLEEDPRSRVFAPLAEAYRKVGLLENAFQVLKKGLRYNPDYLLGYLCLAQCYMDKGEMSLAYTTLRPLAAQHRDNIKLQKLFAESSYSTENFEEALDTYKYLLYIQPKDKEEIERVAELELRLSEDVIYTQHSEEITFDVDNLKATPESDKILDDWVQLDLSREHEETEEEEEDEDEWSVGVPDEEEELIDLVPEKEEKDITPVITHTLVDLYLNQGYTEKARELLEKILELQPNNEETLRRLNKLNESEDSPVALVEDNVPESQADGVASDEGYGNLLAAIDK